MMSIQTSVIPPALAARIEEAGLNASAPPQQRLVDGWLVRFSPGKAKRARCVNAVSAGRLPLEHKLALCQQVFDEAALPMLLRVTPFSEPHGLDALLERQGMRRMDDTRVMACAVPSPQAAAPLPNGCSLSRVGPESFAQTVGNFRGSPLAQRQAHGHRLANAPVPFSAFVLRHEGTLAACGQVALEGELVGLYDVFTAPPFRGRGFARGLCRQLLAHAATAGARTAYLQVDADNQPARAVYGQLGFADVYAYHYRVPQGQADR
jgi:GNAT superfamily N-acetyltransferase